MISLIQQDICTLEETDVHHRSGNGITPPPAAAAALLPCEGNGNVSSTRILTTATKA
jgi:hypothetical protein